MNATNPLCASAVRPIIAISNMIIGNMNIFRLLIYNSKISLIIDNFNTKKLYNILINIFHFFNLGHS